MIGVVIPTLDEERALPALLGDLARIPIPVDLLVADGGSRDRTAMVATQAGARVLGAARGRAAQLNAGAAATAGSWLLFLHADSRLPVAARRVLLAAVIDAPDLQWAVFRFAIDLPGWWGRFVTVGQRLREAMLGLPYGDQGLLVRRDLFETVGGFPELPIMEDVAMVRRLRRHARGRTLPAPLVTSSRRYTERGPARVWLQHSALLLLYLLGVPPRVLARWRTPR